jgi:tryptophan synthase alpha chain
MGTAVSEATVSEAAVSDAVSYGGFELGTVGATLQRARDEGRAALIGYLPVGYPDVDGSIAAMEAMVAGGVDVVEVGLPYSDPVMDGPVIQRAVDPAVRAGVGPRDVQRAVAALSALSAPAVVMSYWNPIEHYGVDRFAADLAAVGGAGLITPDLIPDEAGPWLAASAAHGLDRIFLVAPSSTDARIAMTVGSCRGFVYAASTMGVTGTRASVGSGAAQLVGRVRAIAPDAMVCVGLGVSTGAQAAEVAQFADGVIVGSAFVRCLLDAPDRASGIQAIGDLAAELSAGVRRPRVASQ